MWLGTPNMVPKKWARFIPIPVAMAIPFYIGSYFAVDMCTGSLILFIWEKRNKAEAAAFGSAVASGLICGEGLWSVPKSILAIAKIYPPICMKFLSRRTNVNVDTFIATLVAASDSLVDQVTFGRVSRIRLLRAAADPLMRSSLDFYTKFYNSLGRASNRCSSSIGETRGVVIVHSRNRLRRFDHGLTEF
ncbi:probable metal-nicotianamine transporter YSL7 [Tanacetum coccineum]